MSKKKDIMNYVPWLLEGVSDSSRYNIDSVPYKTRRDAANLRDTVTHDVTTDSPSTPQLETELNTTRIGITTHMIVCLLVEQYCLLQ